MRIKFETFRKLGKTSLAVSVAWLVFGIIQPTFTNRFSVESSLMAVLGFLVFLTLGIILLNRGAER